MRWALTIFLFTTLLSCNNRKDHGKALQVQQNSTLDSLLQKHFKIIETSDWADTTDFSFKALRAYISKDTLYFKRLDTIAKRAAEDQKMWYGADTCVHLPRVQDMRTDEAYRFVYSEAFCHYVMNITVSKKGKDFNLHVVRYRSSFNPSSSKLLEEYDKKLTPKDWDDIKSSLHHADFWGLRARNGSIGFDGDEIDVYGYRNDWGAEPFKYSHVHRLFVEHTTLQTPYLLVLKLSGATSGCPL